MKIILCVDDNLGYSFNGRRLSRDRKMREHMLGVLRKEGAGLLMNSYSQQSLLKENGLMTDGEIREAAENPAEKGSAFLEKALQSGSWAFVENVDIGEYLDQVREMMIYSWNRLYLSDLRLKREFLEGFDTAEEENFRGSSHDCIGYRHLVRKG